MMRRGTIITTFAVLAAALPATAHAGDPLLSGYSGPGGGAQVVLGGYVSGDGPSAGGGAAGGGATSGGGAAPVTRSLDATASVQDPAAGTAAGTAASAAAPRRGGATTGTERPSRRAQDRARSATGAQRTSTAPTLPGTVAPTLAVRDAERAGGDAGLPFTGGDLALLLGGLGIAGLAGYAAGRARRQPLT